MNPGHNKQKNILRESSPIGKMDSLPETAAFIDPAVWVDINQVSQDRESKNKKSHRYRRNPTP